ncbi:hypothetical protein [Caulobacter segnis]
MVEIREDDSSARNGGPVGSADAGTLPALATALITLIEHFERVDASYGDRAAIDRASKAYADYLRYARDIDRETRGQLAGSSDMKDRLPPLCHGERVWVRATVEHPGGDGRNVTIKFDGMFNQTAVVFANQVEHWPTGRLFSWGGVYPAHAGYLSAEQARAALDGAERVHTGPLSAASAAPNSPPPSSSRGDQ